jgi:T4 bacteriophage base plate protein
MAAPPARALVLLAAAEDETSHDPLLDVPVGQVDARLLELRQLLIGRDVEATTACPGCAEEVELEFALDDIRVEQQDGGVHVEKSGYEVWCRSPTARDLELLAPPGDATRRLLARCIERAEHKNKSVGASKLPRAVLAALDDALERANAQADVVLSLICPACGCAWQVPFDIGAFLWEEVDARATALLLEIDALARAYGWREPDILALSPQRRARYLDLVLA